MEVVDEGAWLRSPLDPGPLDRVYFEAAAEGRLIFQVCPSCGHRQFPPKTICVSCGGDPVWLEAEGVGTIHTFTVLRRHGVVPFDDMVPFVLAMIDLPEGVRLMGNVVGVEPELVSVGDTVEAYAIRVDEWLALPTWRVPVEGEKRA